MNSDTQNIASFIKENVKPEIKQVPDDVSIITIPKTSDVKSLKPFLDEYLEKPERRKGTAKADDLRSLIELTNRLKKENSALFAQGYIRFTPEETPVIRCHIEAVLDYTPQGPKDTDWCQHSVRYDFPVSKQFKTWIEQNENAMSQIDFAAFLEDNIADVMGDDGETSLNGLEILKPKFAEPADLVGLSRGLSIRAEDSVKAHHNLQSGECQIEYNSEHKDELGKALSVPNFFLLSIPVFERGDHYKIPVRLRYRVRAGAIKWFFQMYRIEAVFDHAFDQACDNAKIQTELPLYIGAPEKG